MNSVFSRIYGSARVMAAALALAISMILLFVVPAMAQLPTNYVTVRMLRFDVNWNYSGELCSNGDMNRGCTASSSLAYPFGSTNPVTVLIDGTATNNRYLRDVVVREMGPGVFHQTALTAQAIAARTYAYWHVYYSSTINNSTDYQLFVPRSYDVLVPVDKAKIDAAMAHQYYLSEGGNTSSIFSEFFADIPEQTIAASPPKSYLISVLEPISMSPKAGHGRGMSQNGAGRWARGNQNPNVNSTGTAWSVLYPQYSQVLTHYYTGIQMRSIYPPHASLTPSERWVPLWQQWDGEKKSPTFVCKGMRYQVRFLVQNTGTSTWYFNSADQYLFDVSIAGVTGAASVPAGATNRPLADVPPGKTFVATLFVRIPSDLPVTTVNISFDMKKNGVPFGNTGWYAYSLGNLLYSPPQCNYRTFFPSMRYPPYITTWWPQ